MKLIHAASALLTLGASAVDFGSRNGGLFGKQDAKMPMGKSGKCDEPRPPLRYFNRIATFPVCSQIDINCDTDEETVAEIVVATEDGMTLVYSDAEQENIGIVDITVPSNPEPLGVISLAGEPTSVAMIPGSNHAAVAINTSSDYVNTSGELVIVDIDEQVVLHSFELGGQPDSVAVSPDGKYIVIAIENERDEELGDGEPPQMPAGFVVIFDNKWKKTEVSLLGLDILFPEDPEPEYVSINEENIAVVTLQENNAIVIIDLKKGEVIDSTAGGSVDLVDIDTEEEGVINQTSMLNDVAHEPDGVTWMGNEYFATANEGDLFGGSRSFSIYKCVRGSEIEEVYNSGNLLEKITASIGHYPEERSGNKGNEPENVAYDPEHKLLFVNSERSSVTLVFDVLNPEEPIYRQVLPSTVGPEGAYYIKGRGLLAVAGEKDDRGDKIRSAITIHHYGDMYPNYPTVQSLIPDHAAPIPFGALSGLSASYIDGSSILYSVEDSFYKKSRIFAIDSATSPPTVVDAIRIMDTGNVLASVECSETRIVDDIDNDFSCDDLQALINDDKTVNLDLEGIVAVDDGFWVVHEGRGTIDEEKRPIESINLLIHVNYVGVIKRVATLPAEVNEMQLRFGFEGVASYEDYIVVAHQRAWGDEDHPRISFYNPMMDAWSHVFYPLDSPESQNGGWVGIGDIHHAGEGEFIVLERDNQGGPDAAIKKIYSFTITDPESGIGSVVDKTLVRDILEDVSSKIGALTFEKVEGLTISHGNVWISTDNDGADDNSGETQLQNLGDLWE
ncbi:hypothetical protein THAOC_34583 [Thalassiosira oceanica]|uniref:Phytase-like domain-containing protein n=2 Tax=Thalassiosira oceanica TaxID=159749 RepID=K0RCG6_THAOC|nr:hypothetical protein THAOC_34583 [Thalassiosira oceanica]|eukprot:EJK46736.1 hypothetical protein THAOC_34583 [Thalassiosira oceanica]